MSDPHFQNSDIIIRPKQVTIKFRWLLIKLRTMSLPESRLHSLYKDFRALKQLNPDGYLANITTWRSFLIEKFLNNSESLLFHCGSDLLHSLRREPYGTPKSIDLVINQLVEDGYLTTLEDFASGSMYPKEGNKLLKWIGFCPSYRKSFFSRANEKPIDYLKEVDLLIRPALEQKYKEVYSRLEKKVMCNATGIADLVFGIEDFYEVAGFRDILKREESNYKIMMNYLSRYRNVIIHDESTVKIIAQPVASVLKGPSNIITEDDVRVALLKKTLANVNTQIAKVEGELSKYDSALKKSFNNGSTRGVQREYLLGKKLAQKYLSKLLSYRSMLSSVTWNINVASTNEMVIISLNNSKDLLKAINESAGSADKLHDLLDEIEDEKSKTKEITDLLSNDENFETDDEIEQELQAMLEKQDLIRSDKPGESTDDIAEKLEHLKISPKELKQHRSEKVSEPPRETNLNSNIIEKQPIAES